ncbi:hypothetical protein [Wohlfahrtiimonas chitiniclastica]|uniref:Uncharacterized protein n=1 Tax=Wohlfahrtiimonas chitiniclastica SH04 TaxID=1261130 RepID=L8XT27_9GAMM|nr:hypothetical protein [Wohlfahrtiimonas chitiniclastica]ELV07178.1 Hypothetical protein F387_02009 [Wohlfahrtiimonas chitiniclastica SH04]KZX37294.1 hypothetical protein A6V30_10010 [Wohlfahrtiimonas chitiniclastica]MBS7815688.1 hypothetical protein [Wohlfahrtiimonas chitiniclastica]MBS7837212.1 hypothetical protein [Wohlfahrtiimonas chitiniclastica]MBS7839177.1 hypothetical protein [Wohlfahrtiimonas chitiniclastica]
MNLYNKLERIVNGEEKLYFSNLARFIAFYFDDIEKQIKTQTLRDIASSINQFIDRSFESKNLFIKSNIKENSFYVAFKKEKDKRNMTQTHHGKFSHEQPIRSESIQQQDDKSLLTNLLNECSYQLDDYLWLEKVLEYYPLNKTVLKKILTNQISEEELNQMNLSRIDHIENIKKVNNYISQKISAK